MPPFGLLSQCFRIMVAEFCSFFRREIGLLCRVEMFFHLFYDMFRLQVMLNLKVRGGFDYLMGMPADRAELPFLEPVHVRERPARWTPDNEVHDKEVIRVILINIYRRKKYQKELPLTAAQD
jgi:hypothetical protein